MQNIELLKSMFKRSVILESERNSEFFEEGRCPYIKSFLSFIKELISMLNEDLEEYFDWTAELIETEKRCLGILLRDCLVSFKQNRKVTVESFLLDEYFEALSFKHIEDSFSGQIQMNSMIREVDSDFAEFGRQFLNKNGTHAG